MDTSYRCFNFNKAGLFTIDYIGWTNNDRYPSAQVLNKTLSNKLLLSFGQYNIYNDTIIAIYVHKAFSLNDSWTVERATFLVENDNKLRLVGLREMKGCESPSLDSLPLYFINKPMAEFVTLDKVPKPDNWLIKKKWFWKDKMQYKEWKKSLKWKKN